MKIQNIKTQKEFDHLMSGVNAGVVRLKQVKDGVQFDLGKNIIQYVDFVNYYNFFNKEKHGKDQVLWEMKTKRYVVEVRSHVSAEMIVFANSKEQVLEIAQKDMDESLDKQIRNARPHEFIRNLNGYTEVLKSSIKMEKK